MHTEKANYTICNCKQVIYFDIEDALRNGKKFSDVEKTFEDVQKITSCTTGCGRYHQKTLNAILQIMMNK